MTNGLETSGSSAVRQQKTSSCSKTSSTLIDPLPSTSVESNNQTSSKILSGHSRSIINFNMPSMGNREANLKKIVLNIDSFEGTGNSTSDPIATVDKARNPTSKISLEVPGQPEINQRPTNRRLMVSLSTPDVYSEARRVKKDQELFYLGWLPFAVAIAINGVCLDKCLIDRSLLIDLTALTMINSLANILIYMVRQREFPRQLKKIFS